MTRTVQEQGDAIAGTNVLSGITFPETEFRVVEVDPSSNLVAQLRGVITLVKFGGTDYLVPTAIAAWEIWTPAIRVQAPVGSGNTRILLYFSKRLAGQANLDYKIVRIT